MQIRPPFFLNGRSNILRTQYFLKAHGYLNNFDGGRSCLDESPSSPGRLRSPRLQFFSFRRLSPHRAAHGIPSSNSPTATEFAWCKKIPNLSPVNSNRSPTTPSSSTPNPPTKPFCGKT